MVVDTTANIISQWKLEKIELNPPASGETISEAEKIINFIFPSEFRNLYLKVNGFKNWDWRANMFSIWPIERIVDEYNQGKAKDFVGFSDYLINSYQIGFFKGRIGIYKSYDEFNPIAHSFDEAILLINSDADLIY